MLHPPADIASWAERIRSGDERALARALSAIERRDSQADSLLQSLFDVGRRAWRVGITGAPGAGKSTLVNRLVSELRASGRTVAVLAVDPTSPFTGGAILGDRVRMLSHHADSGVFIRSMAARGSLGGLAPAAADLITVLEAAGRDVVIIETVGVGQAEVDVVGLASVTALALTPQMGDDVQALKAGVMEIADVYVVNKADLPGADRAEQQIQAMLSLNPDAERRPPIVRTIASSGEGVPELLAALEGCQPKRGAQEAYWRNRLLYDLRGRLAEELLPLALDRSQIEQAALDAAAGRLNPYRLVSQVIADLKGRLEP